MNREKELVNGAAVTWGCFIACIFLLFYHEKVFFDDYIQTGIDYGLVLGLTLGGFLLITLVGKKIPTKGIVGLLWCVLLISAVLWVLLGAALPLEPSDSGCLDPICQVPGQVALITLELGITAPLLVEYFRRSWQAFSSAMRLNAGPWAGAALLVAGLISLVGYYWTYLTNVCLSILTALGVLKMSAHKGSSEIKSEGESRGVSIYFGQFLRDFVMLVFVGVFGFSIMERDAYSFETLIPFGIGFLVFSLALHYGTPLWGEPGATKLLEGITIGILTLITGFALYMLLSDAAVVLPISLPPWAVGFAAGFIWHRVELLLTGMRMRNDEKKLHFRKVPIDVNRDFMFLLFLAGLFVLVVINIDPDGTDSILILDLALIIGILYVLFWVLNYRRNSPKEISRSSS